MFGSHDVFSHFQINIENEDEFEISGNCNRATQNYLFLFLQTRFVSHDVSNLLIAKCNCNPFKKLNFSTFIVCNTIFLLPQFSVKSQQDTKLINFIVENIAMSKKISTLK